MGFGAKPPLICLLTKYSCAAASADAGDGESRNGAQERDPSSRHGRLNPSRVLTALDIGQDYPELQQLPIAFSRAAR